MTRASVRLPLYAALGLLFLLRHDLWLWNDPRRIAGLPLGLAYHIGYCAAAALVMGLLVRFAWPPWPER